MDADPHFAHQVREVLTGRGWAVLICQEGLECLEKAQSFKPDAAVVELMLPDMTGVDVLNFLRNSPYTRITKLIACSAKAFRPEIKTVGELDGVFFPKPISPEDLADRVDEVTGRKEPTPDHAPLTQMPPPPPASICFRPILSRSEVYIKFWGTRGSVPVSGKQYLVHGGNTSCLEIRQGEDVVILDAGTGIRPLGIDLFKAGRKRIHLFISHTHWDHIQGFPFFTPAFMPGSEISIYGASGFGRDLREVFRGQLDKDYFPIQLEDFLAKIDFRILTEHEIRIGALKIGWEWTNHPGAALCYRVELEGKSLAYVSDNEFARGFVGAPQELDRNHPAVVPDHRLIDFLQGVDILVHEAQYTNEEYPQRIGWGHSSLTNSCRLAQLVGAQRWLVTHHDPGHSDEVLDRKLLLTRQVLSDLGHPIEVFHAVDGMVHHPW